MKTQQLNSKGRRPFRIVSFRFVSFRFVSFRFAAGEISLDGIEWAFSEEYTEACPRVLGGRKIAVYWFAVSGGKVSCGWDDLPDWVLALQPVREKRLFKGPFLVQNHPLPRQARDKQT
jgi:hypothetical protein